MIRVARVLPDVKLIISLRDPLARMHSMYLKNFYQGKISHSFEEEIVRERDGSARLRLVSRSQYDRDLHHIFDLFPSENIKIMIFEEWTQDHNHAMADLYRFIGCDSDFSLDQIAGNESARYRKAADTRRPDANLTPETRRYLLDATAGSRTYVERLIGRPVPWVME